MYNFILSLRRHKHQNDQKAKICSLTWQKHYGWVGSKKSEDTGYTQLK
jgi:hypothetical protein